jgi:hypothetical protein
MIAHELEVAASRPMRAELRLVRAGGRALRVLSLARAHHVALATNFFHGTWHILMGSAGALALARLLTGLVAQDSPDTVAVIDAPHLGPTPFEADPSLPVIIVPAGRTAFDVGVVRALRRGLAQAPRQPITLPGLGAPTASPRRWAYDAQERRERVSRAGGAICVTSPATLLRLHATWLRGAAHHGSGYQPLGPSRACAGEGELQVVPGFEASVRAARVARGRAGVAADVVITDDEQRQDIWSRVEALRGRQPWPRRKIARPG